MQQGLILDTTSVQQDLTTAGEGSTAEPVAQGRLSITTPPTQPQAGLRICNPVTSGFCNNPQL